MTHELRHALLRFLIDLVKLAAAAVIGVFVYAAAFQAMVMAGLLAADLDGEGYGHKLTQEAVTVWAGAILVGFIAIFIHKDWRWPLLIAPLYAPALFALIRVASG